MGWFQGGQWGGSKTQGWFKAIVAVVATTWSATDKADDWALSNGNLTAANPGNNAGLIRATNPSNASGWQHFEVKINSLSAGGNAYVSLTSGSIPTTGAGGQASGANNVTLSGSGTLTANGGAAASTGYTTNDVLGFDYNQTTGEYYITKNGSLVNNGSGSISAGLSRYPAANVAVPATLNLTLNVGQTAFASNPNGRPAWG